MPTGDARINLFSWTSIGVNRYSSIDAGWWNVILVCCNLTAFHETFLFGGRWDVVLVCCDVTAFDQAFLANP